MLVTVAIAKTFCRALEKLPHDLQNQVKTTVFDFQQDPLAPGFSLHQVDRSQYQGWWSLRVNDDLRIILCHQGGSYILCHVDHHEDAYRWARQRRCDIDATGALRVILTQEEIVKVVRRVEVDAPLSRYSPEYLIRLGVPEEWVETLRNASEEGLIALIDEFPEEVWERIEDLLKGKPVPIPVPIAVEDPLRHPDNRRRFWTPENLQELERSLNLPWEQWLVYLHPLQRSAVEARYNGPARVSGGAGTGKTVVAVHRTAELARRYPSARILLTTFSRTLAVQLKKQLALLTSKIPNNVTVAHLHSLARRWGTQRYGSDFTIVDDKALRAYMNTLLEKTCLTFSSGFVWKEWQHVIDMWNVRTLDDYLSIPRIGRKAPLRPEGRRQLWNVFQEMWRWLESSNAVTWIGLCYRLLEESGSLPKYRCVVVDEAQDFGPAELKLIRAICGATEDDLFLCGDAEQRIYRTGSPWSALGIQTRGRSTRLRVNYRTTAQIQCFAESLLPEYATDEDELVDQDSYLRPLALLRGAEPYVRPCSTPEQEADALTEWFWLRVREGYRLGEMAVFARSRGYIEEHIAPELENRGLPVHWLDDHELPDGDRVNIGTAHRAKGLEFKVVAVVGASDYWFPCRPALVELEDPMERQDFERQERQLLYVACTRAREKLWVSFCNTASPFLRK